MSDKESKTEEATPRRRQKAREEGQVARSQDVSSVATFVGGVGVLAALGVTVSTAVARHTATTLANLDAPSPFAYAGDFGSVLVLAVLPVAGAAMLMALIAGFAQVGWNPTVKPLIPDLKKLDPIKKSKQLFFSTNSLVEVLKALAKIVIIGAIVAELIYDQIAGSSAWTAATAGQLIDQMGEMSFDIAWRAVIAMILLALVDYYWQRHQHNESLKMTKQEVKEEYKDMEGDPHIKGRRRAKAREMAGLRAQAVSEAAVVVVNPTHVAVALRYQPPDDQAPVVIAKGVDEGALRVREEARRHSIPIHHDPPLARQLAKRVRTGKAVPPDLYRAVAAVLAAVLQKSSRR